MDRIETVCPFIPYDPDTFSDGSHGYMDYSPCALQKTLIQKIIKKANQLSAAGLLNTVLRSRSDPVDYAA